MQVLTRAECASWLLARDNFTILTHRKPDGDTLGSAAALCRALRQVGKTAHILKNDEVTELYAPLMEGLTKEMPQEGDTLIAVDVAADNMLPRAYDDLKNCIDLRIDHHGSGREYTPAELVESDMAACAELVWELLPELGAELDKEMAEAIYVGVSTDTGCFHYANTTDHSFDTAADCAAAGADIFHWNTKIFETVSLAKLKLQGWIAEHAEFFCDGKLALCALPKAVEDGFGVDEDDMSNISSFLRSIEGVRMAALLRETESGFTKVSLRAIPGYNAAAVCEIFGGGGHAGAAGCSLKQPLEEASKAVAKAMIDWENS